jgi:iduronate 2-sulfatase
MGVVSKGSESMLRRYRLSVVWLLMCVLGSVVRVGAADRPNVLLICVDDLKPVLACYGDQQARTPAIDGLAARGVRFERAFCNQAVCSPSRNSLMTGLRPQTLGIYDLGTHFRVAVPDAVTLSQHFRQQGYVAEGLGKILHTGHGNVDDPASWSVPSWRARVPAYAEARNAADSEAGRDAKGAAWEAAEVPDSQYADGQTAEEAIRRLRGAKERGTPFFLAVGFLKPHLPFVAPQKYWDLYERESFAVAERQTAPEGAPSYAAQAGGELRNYRGIPARGVLPEEQQRTLIHGYYAAMSYMDAQVGRVLDELERLGLADKTIVVLWGDHGWHLGDHGMWCKHTNYEQAARIPLVVSGPGLPRGEVSRSLVETVDVYPTLAELAGLTVPLQVEGRSFAGVLREPDRPHREHVIHVYPRTMPERGSVLGRAIRTERYRLVEWKAPGAPAAEADLELYDYETDPEETRNQAGQQPEVVRQLRELLAGHPEAKPQIRVEASKTGGGAAGGSGVARDRNGMFDRRDTNWDGTLSRVEFLASQPDADSGSARFMKMDRDGDGSLSRDEFVGADSKSAKPAGSARNTIPGRDSE